jgi:GTP-binding protein Era
VLDKEKKKIINCKSYIKYTPNRMKKILNVAICGAPNAGKSTFLNAIVKEKISIVSPKVQTTRNAIRGIANFGDTQIIFTDTPGIFRARKDFTLEKRISGLAWKIVRSSSVVMLLIDGISGLTKETYDILADFKRREKTLVAVINKIDKMKEKDKLDLGIDLEKQGDTIEAIFYISAIEDTGVPKLIDYLKLKGVDGNWLFNDDTVSDISENMTVAEIVREKIFLELKDEIPYHTSVQTESFQEEADGILASVLVTVTKESQKIIMIGKRGIMLKTIKHASEEELSNIFQKPVKVHLFIRVRSDWREKEDYYKYMNIE